MKLHHGRFRLDKRKRIFTERVVSNWNWLPTELVTAPSLSEFKEHLNDDESHGLVLGSPVKSGELNSMNLMGPFQLEILYDSMAL